MYIETIAYLILPAPTIKSTPAAIGENKE